MLQLLQKMNPGKEYPANTGVKWTDEEDKILLAEIASDIDYNIIADNHKRTVGGIHARRREIAFKMYCSCMSIDEISRKTKLPPDEINLTISRRKEPVEKKKKSDAIIDINLSGQNDLTQLKSELVGIKSDIVSMRNEIFELKKTINGLAEMLKLVYEFETEQ